MRHFLFALLIALLPLRGWVGDAMATQMAADQLPHQTLQAEAQAGHVHEAEPEAALALHDCADQAHDGSSHAAGGRCDTCAACQACHAVALSLAAPELMPAPGVSTLPHSAAYLFTSADAALRKKPPIP